MTKTRNYTIAVLGRTLEHLGVQMYKRRDIAIAELVANCWDAGAETVYISVPTPDDYSPRSSYIIVEDDGIGMSEEQVQDDYLVVGRNRRLAGSAIIHGRPVMGRKGIGKLAGFGVASKMTVQTWQDGQSTQFTLNIQDLKKDSHDAGPVAIPGIIGLPPDDATSPSGTRIILEDLKSKMPLDLDKLREALGRRFSRKVFGRMKIYVNGSVIEEPAIDLEQRFPEVGFSTDKLQDGTEVRYYYAFAKKVISSPEMRGFTIYVRGKTAQAPPFFFQVEGTASGQHGTRYLTGTIEADFLDEGIDDETDIISTDRQEIDWEDTRVIPFKEWGQKITRQALRQWSHRKGEQLESAVLEDPEMEDRINRLDGASQKQVSFFLQKLGEAEPAPERVKELSDALLRAYEYRHFHDVVEQINDVSEDPHQLELLLTHLQEWKVLESRAILEIIRGRLHIIEKFHLMIINDAPETTRVVGADNMHDLLAGYPWLLNPEWQVLTEEKRISTQLKEWGYAEINEEDARLRYDFLALTDERRLVVVEIKRSVHTLELEELQRLERYKEKLSRAHDKDLYMMMLCGNIIGLSKSTLEAWKDRADGEIITWKDVYERTRIYYEHYRAVLEGDVQHDDFSRKERELAQTRNVLARGSVYRGKAARAEGLGPQDVNDKMGQE